MRSLWVSLIILVGMLNCNLLASEQVPVINPQLYTLANAYNCLNTKSAVVQDLAEADSYCAQIDLQVTLTGIEWLDKALLNKFIPGEFSNKATSAELRAGISLAAQEWLQERGQDIRDALAETDPFFAAFEIKQHISFISQRYNLAVFKEFNYYFSGGAHGMYATKYYVFDLAKLQQIKLADLFLAKGQEQVLNLLESKYKQEQPELANTWFDSREEMYQALLKGSFYFNQYGLEFIYAPYELGPYSEGQITLLLDYEQLDGVVKAEYLLLGL